MAVSPTENAQKLEEAEKLAKTDAPKAEAIYKSILTDSSGTNPTAINNLETALVKLGELYRDQKRTDELAELIIQTRDALSSFAKAKVAKLGMSLLSYLCTYSNHLIQSDNFSTSSPQSPIQPKHKSPLQNNASSGLSRSAAASCART